MIMYQGFHFEYRSCFHTLRNVKLVILMYRWLPSMVSVGAGCSQLLSDMQAFKVRFSLDENLSC